MSLTEKDLVKGKSYTLISINRIFNEINKEYTGVYKGIVN